MKNVVGHRETDKGLQLGLLYSAPEALKIGLVDELVPEDKVLSAAAETMTKWLAIPGKWYYLGPKYDIFACYGTFCFYDSISPPTDHARQISKSMMRKSTIDKLLANREADTTNFVSFITKDSIQKSLGVYMEMLKKRRSWGPKHVLVVDVAFMELISVTVYHTVLVLLLGGNFVCK